MTQEVTAMATKDSRLDPYGLLEVIERALTKHPELRRANKALLQLGEWIDEQHDAERQRVPFSERNYQLGDVRAATERELLDTFLEIPLQWGKGMGGIIMNAFSCFLALANAPPDVRADGMELLKRERYVPYVNTFLTLRDKGHVALTAKSVPAKGGHTEAFKL